MQEQMKFMSDFEDYQDVESNSSGRLSHVSSQPEMIPSSRSLLSRDKRLPFDTWNQSGVQENVFGNQFSTIDSPRDFAQRSSSDDVHRNREAALGDPKVKTSLTSEEGQNYGTIPMPMLATRTLTISSAIPLELPQNHVVGQQRQQMSELQFDKFPTPASNLGVENKIKNTGLKWFWFSVGNHVVVEMVDSLEELKSSRLAC